LELWDRFDVGCNRYYKDSPWCPANNVNYTSSESGLPEKWEPGDSSIHKHPFYHSVPDMDNNQMVLSLQKKFADKVLSISLKYDHVLYVITNESTLDPDWSDFWAKYIRLKAKDLNKKVEVSEMPWTIADDFPFGWQKTQLKDPNIWIDHVINNSETYSFCAFQFQPILKSHQEHYDRLSLIHKYVANHPTGLRPVNAVKIFAHERVFGAENEENAQSRFWRPLMTGWAAVSLHRQYGDYLGFTNPGKRNLSAARKFCDLIIPWDCKPAQHLFQNREPDEAYLIANPGKSYGLYFPTTGSVDIDLKDFTGSQFTLRWISIETGEFYGAPKGIKPNPTVALRTPDSGSNAGWAATLVNLEKQKY
jgi:hypothetical protein